MRRLVSICARWWDVALVVALTLGAYLWLTGPAWAMTVTVDGVIATVSADEPTQNEPNADGQVTPLDDLAWIEFYYQTAPDPAPVQCGVVAATSPAGGGAVSGACPVPLRDREVKVATFTAVAMDTSGNRSAPSAGVETRLDKLPPDRPR